ncbi:hypothetical protein Vretimale_2305 [Volvox reticuliferus]|uniref:Uncharacterized protein n=1 Tax=Volvox reticuliferus TaxID=1737510 RepID=A0A8J4FZ60_9CHLO|nr:hypothetical protein Vretifemale_4586 [Volvox reticuliferus]GIL96507.1 hypothetical protein Vretimale_2305 [Volvox reticuliferus]
MPSGEQEGLVSGAPSSTLNVASKKSKINKFRGLICWGIFGAFLIFFIIMAAVYTDPKRYKEATVMDYLNGEDAVLYNGLGQSYFFPSTRKMNAQAYFQLGLLLMNVFWYDLAIQKFQQARTMDPNLAMAYWGEAMCYKRPLWQMENATAARAVLGMLDQSQALKNTTAREQRYVAAARTLFAANTSVQVRETQYTNQMKALWEGNPDDPDACALYGLSLLGQLQSLGGYATNSDDLLYLAEDTLKDCTYNFPRHVGSWHYLTHVYDVNDVNVASKGVGPAQALAQLAPRSNVAQHMASHFYVRFGNWTWVVQSNQNAVAASDSYCGAVDQGNACDADNRWHALEWQLYGQTQQCAAKDAYTTYMRMQKVAASMNYTGDYGQWLYRSYAHLQLQSMNSLGIIPLRNQTDNATSMLPPPLYDTGAIQDAPDIMDHFWPPHAEAHALLARVYSLTYQRNSSQLHTPGVNDTITKALKRMDDIVNAQNALFSNASAAAAATSLNTGMLTQLIIAQLQANAVYGASICAAKLPSCNNTYWIALMDKALMLYSNISSMTTLPSIEIAPTPEFYGNLLVDSNTTAAKELFRSCLSKLPGRMSCVLGLARASYRLNLMSDAMSWDKQLLSQCSVGDKTFPAVLEARSRLPSPSPPPSKKGLLRRVLRDEAIGQAA